MKNISPEMTHIVQWLRTTCPEGQLYSDSREIGSDAGNAVFFAYEGDSADGRHFIASAIEKGVAAVVYEQSGFEWNPQWQVPHLAVAGLKDNAGPIAAAYYDFPARSMLVIAATGTNGKTSCTQWIGQSISDRKENGRDRYIGNYGF